MDTDKFYVILIIGMIGIFIYWYQTRLDQEALTDQSPTVYCAGCQQKMIKRKNKNLSKNSDTKLKPKDRTRKHKKRKSKTHRKVEPDTRSDDTIPDELIESRLRKRRQSSKKSSGNKRDDETEISIESLDTIDRSDISGPKRDNDSLDMVDCTIDSDADTIDLD